MPLNLKNVYSTRNIGDAAILKSLAMLSPDNLARGNVPDANPLSIPGLVATKEIDQTMPFASVGGDIFNNGRPGFITRRFIANLAELSANAPRTFMFGQSIPRSCKSIAFKLLSSCLNRLASVTVRDEESHRRLRAAGINSYLSYDCAFALGVSPNAIYEGRQILESYHLSPEKTVLLSLRGFDHMYPVDGEQFTSKFCDTVHRLSQRGHQCAVIIQADAGSADSDRLHAQILQKKAPITIIDLIEDTTADPVSQLQALLAAANVVIAVRYHTAILRLLARRQAVVLSYSNKTRDLIDRLGVTGCDIDDLDPAKLVALAENSADQTFNPDGPAESVRDHFTTAFLTARYPRGTWNK